MMSARATVAALKGKWHGSYGMARCVSHDDRRPSLKICDGGCGRLLIFCYAGCDSRDVLAELRRRGLIDADSGGADSQTHEIGERIRLEAEADRLRRIAWARRIWKESKAPAGTPVELYLRGRGIVISAPPSLRFHPRLEYAETGQIAPAMVAAVQSASREIVAVHRTFITVEGQKAFGEDSKRSLGPTVGGAVRLARAQPDKWLAVAEGIETALAVMQATGLPAWAALSTSGMRSLDLPPDIKIVTICADNDESGAGEAAAKTAADRWKTEGRQVSIAIPPTPGTDFNDVLRGVSAASILRGQHVVAA